MIDIKIPVTNPSLLEAIRKSRENSTIENRSDVVSEVINARFLNPIVTSLSLDQADSNGEFVLKEATKFGFEYVEDNDHKFYFLAFTDWNELYKWRHIENEKQNAMIIKFDDYAAMLSSLPIQHDGFIINFSGVHITFTREMIERFKRQKDQQNKVRFENQTVEKGARIVFGPPKVYPHDLVNAICIHSKDQRNIKALYLQTMIKDHEQSYLIVVDFEGSEIDTFRGLAEAGTHYFSDMPIDMIKLDSDFGKIVANKVAPFYKRDQSIICL